MNKKQMLKEQKRLKQQQKEVATLFKDDKEVFGVFKIALGVIIFIGLAYVAINIFNGNWNVLTKNNKATTEFNSKLVMAGTMFNKEEGEYLVLAYDMSSKQDNLYAALASNYSNTTRNLYYLDLSSGFNSSFVSDKETITSDLTKLKFSGPTLLVVKGEKIIKSYTKEQEIINFFSQK